ncbi:MAG TPA: hypothetical protein VLD66_02415 [Methyloceanibacter sp.]|nr:hypothetical protein [Methyloceanibacter sp.]
MAAWSPLRSSAKEPRVTLRVGHSDRRTKETHPMRGILLWLIGIPIPIIILLWLFGVLH